jgi:hypothetical protein
MLSGGKKEREREEENQFPTPTLHKGFLCWLAERE